MLRHTHSKSRLMVLSACAVAGLGAAGALRSELLLSRGFDKALESNRPGLSFGSASQQTGAGDEGYWLTRAEVESPTPLVKPLAIGDRITIAGQDGRERKLEVIDLKAIGSDPVLRTGTIAPQARLLLVICKVADGDGREAPVRFIIEAETPAPHHVTSTASKAL
jgi:hypothetical protein